MSVDELIEKFQSNELAALQQYGSNRLLVTGTIGEISPLSESTARLTLYSEYENDIFLRCEFNQRSEIAKLTEFVRGQSISVSGMLNPDSKWPHLSLNRCSVRVAESPNDELDMTVIAEWGFFNDKDNVGKNVKLYQLVPYSVYKQAQSMKNTYFVTDLGNGSQAVVMNDGVKNYVEAGRGKVDKHARFYRSASTGNTYLIYMGENRNLTYIPVVGVGSFSSTYKWDGTQPSEQDKRNMAIALIQRGLVPQQSADEPPPQTQPVVQPSSVGSKLNSRGSVTGSTSPASIPSGSAVQDTTGTAAAARALEKERKTNETVRKIHNMKHNKANL